ncbi:GtrA family protein [Angustibacter luteus]
MPAVLQRHSDVVRQVRDYFGVAAVGLLVDVGVLVALTSGLGVNHLVGATAGFLCGLVVTYVLSERYVFSSPKIVHAGARFLLFAAIGLVGLFLLDGLMWLLTDRLGLFYLWSKALATAVVYVWNFVARRSMYGAAQTSAP